MPKKILAFLGLLILSGLAIASRAPDCYDMGGTSETCSGVGERNDFFDLLQNVVLILVIAGLGYAFLKDKLFREGVTKYVLTLGAMLIGFGVVYKIFGKEAAMFGMAGVVWYLWSTDPAKKKKSVEKHLDDQDSSRPTDELLPEPLTLTPHPEDVEDVEDISDPNREFDFHWGVPAVEWFERRYPRIDHDRDQLANKAEERYSQKHGIDMMGADLKLPWLIGYEEGRYAALKMTDRTKKQAMRKADKEFNFHDEVLKKIFYDGYDAGFEAW